MRFFLVVFLLLFQAANTSFVVISHYTATNNNQNQFTISQWLRALRLASTEYNLDVHVCAFDPLESSLDRDLTLLGAHTHRLFEAIPTAASDWVVEGWKSLHCSMFVSQWLVLRRHYSTQVVYLHHNLLILNDQLFHYLSPRVINARSLWCHHRSMDAVPPRSCSLLIYSFTAAIGNELYGFYNASNGMIDSPHQFIQASVGSVLDSVHIIASSRTLMPGDGEKAKTFVNVVGAGEYWLSESSTASIIEIDGVQHSIRVGRTTSLPCYLEAHVEWAAFNTVGVISASLEQFLREDSQRGAFVVGCVPVEQFFNSSQLSMFQATPVDPTPAVTRPPRVFDCILFFDELSMLRLRLQVMSSFIDAFIIVESPYTFTGKPKPLYLSDNLALFQEYRHQIVLIVLNELPFPTPSSVGEVWANEYSSRDAAMEGLAAVQAVDSDIVIIADTDEIVHPNAFAVIRSRIAARDSSAFYFTHFKLHMENFMYNFDCYVGSNVTGQPYPLTTVTTLASMMYLGHFTSSAAMHGMSHLLSMSRGYLQLAKPVPWQHVIRPGGWHLSFFESVERIKRKLESYSHQNFVEQFFESSSSTSDDVDVNSVVRLNNSAQLPQGSISVQKLKDRVLSGRHVDPRVKPSVKAHHTADRCQAWSESSRDTWDESVKQRWQSLAGVDDYI